MSLWLRVSVTVAAFLVSVLACGTAIIQTAYYVCPTPVPTAVVPQPTPLPGTPLPFPTPIPLPPTPYIITPPQDFYVGDAVYVGQPGAPLRLRFRLLDIQAQPAEPVSGQPRSLYTWRLEISNLGGVPYETVPVALMVITRIDTVTGQLSGMWNTSEAAMQEAGFSGENYDALQPGSTRIYRLAAYGPAGSLRQLAYTLDGESNRITWVNAANPYCSGDVAD
ncbi:MAG: hypothetical protein IPK52_07760 [Chloroflexi bacterium]|nr:hypothetical protein [Chloroflexota bacterium]